MLRTARPLRLEPCENRSLPAVVVPTSHPPADNAAHSSTTTAGAESDEDEASEYANAAKSATDRSGPAARTSDPFSESALAQVPAYVVAAYPAAPPMPTGPTTPAAVPAAPQAADDVQTVVTAVVPNPPPTSQAPPPAPPVSERAADAPPDDEPIERQPGPQGGTGDQPAVLDTEFSPAGPVASSVPFLDNLDLQLNLSGWAATATRLLDGLDAIASPLDAESPWVRLGYWVLAVGTVGVTVELTRQGLRAKQPELTNGPPLPVTR